jgi:two-component system sensor histidine kinase DegS
VLYRIIQEALQNINKHARKANVAIRSYQQAGVLIVVIRDDGPGFDPREVLRRSGKESWGLTSMRERIALVGGEFAIASRPGSGTEVTLRIAL